MPQLACVSPAPLIADWLAGYAQLEPTAESVLAMLLPAACVSPAPLIADWLAGYAQLEPTAESVLAMLLPAACTF
ncbi:hypothetical protein VIMS_05032 [Mycobacterium marinum]|nr:hypothetical protein VIMS_05032 [Mycobacterium marinum]RFZ25398.1 hypothetical protein DSM43519_01583 [Mycobacterium marinum]RFZ33889.1 hypothetical protein NCTC2275_02736 [Mycobacterium marinum]